jgi:PAS domain S-box-containing protein
VRTFRHSIYDSGVEVAFIELNRSVTPLAFQTFVICVCSFSAGMMIFLIFRFFPLRALQSAYRKVERSEQRLKLALESGHYGICDWDIKNNIMIWDDRMHNIYGVARDSVTVTMEAWQSYLHPEDRNRVMKDITPEMIVKKGFSTEYRIIQDDGTVRHIKTDGILLRDEDGEPSRMISLNNDITERKHLEEERENLLSELQQALLEVKQLSGLLPICASCKKIRNDDGYWEQIEGYIEKHTDAEFSHGICPECSKRLYPELYAKS